MDIFCDTHLFDGGLGSAEIYFSVERELPPLESVAEDLLAAHVVRPRLEFQLRDVRQKRLELLCNA